MSKAVLVIDVPKCCYECFAFDDSGDYPECLITKDFRGYRFRPREQKMYNCPLKPIPEKKLLYTTSSDYLNGFDAGYNACIDEIISE